MSLVLDPAVHVGAADLAGIALNGRALVDDRKLVAVLDHLDIVARHHRDHGEGRAVRLPAFGTAAGVVVRDVAGDRDLDRPVLALADQGAAGKAPRALLHAIVNRGVDMNSHWIIPPLMFAVG